MKRDETLDTLLGLDGDTCVLDKAGHYWVKFEVKRIEPTPEKPHGLDYSLTLTGRIPATRGTVGSSASTTRMPRQI